MFGIDTATNTKNPTLLSLAANGTSLPAPALREITDELSEQYRTYLRDAMGLRSGETQLQVLSGGLDEAAA